ncbi:MAG: hypothetical protein ACXWUL_02135 [Caldimonas sp.]
MSLPLPSALRCIVVLLAGGATAVAGELPDPTRPPQRQSAAAPTGAPTPAPDTPVLQSVLIGPGRAPSAIISGRLVAPGEATHGMRLVRVTETAAVLSGPRGTVTLALTPGAEKRAAAAPAVAPVRTADAAPIAAKRRSFLAEPK